ncbi:transposase [Halorhodospira abdelmalekii]|uniref:transposase n=1 Tax=Halorhodospira abdelmalekii TaxID=421629 RepID=UPI001907BA60|nr:transposase [Halorhodospira abdelmalekii]
MPRPRCEQISPEIPFYHIVTRCVRRTFLCGEDHTTGKSYEHRRQWVEDQIRLLSSIFAIDVATYAVMSNHCHIVVKLDPSQTETWSDDEVIQRWGALYKGPPVMKKYLSGEALDALEQVQLDKRVDIYRERLGELSWFMKCLNEPIARQANKEDGCTGHFWEARFKSQALGSDAALLACMAYVDLNPVRAAIAPTPEECEHTGLRERIEPRFDLEKALRERFDAGVEVAGMLSCLQLPAPVKPLLPFRDATAVAAAAALAGIPCSFEEYLALVDHTGRIINPKKRGAIAQNAAPILQRLGLANAQWLEQATRFEALYRRKGRAHLNAKTDRAEIRSGGDSGEGSRGRGAPRGPG